MAFQKPNSFYSGDPKNILLDMDVSLEKAYAVMEEAGFDNPSQMTLFQWFSRLEYLKQKKPPKNS